MNIEMENFSRTLDVKYFNNAVKIAGELKTKPPMVTTWELLDKAFTFPRVRQYNIVKQELNNIEMFQDNLNQNLSNSVALNNFLVEVGKAKAIIAARYHDGEFVDPATELAVNK